MHAQLGSALTKERNASPGRVPSGAGDLQGKFRERPTLYLMLSRYEDQPKASKTTLKFPLHL